MSKKDLIQYTGWETTVKEMKMLMEKLNIMAPPEESVKIVVAAIECVQAGIRAAMPGKNTGADELIPCTIYRSWKLCISPSILNDSLAG